jgi:hypothetical protein
MTKPMVKAYTDILMDPSMMDIGEKISNMDQV